VLEQQARRCLTQYLTQDALAKVRSEIAEQADAIELPDDLRERVDALIEERPDLAWDSAVAQIVRPLSCGG
jgi:Fe-S cluster assembly scaffold protein SufB